MPPGLRKSGMPDSVLIPAPVKNTTRWASSIIRRNSVMLGSMRPLQMLPCSTSTRVAAIGCGTARAAAGSGKHPRNVPIVSETTAAGPMRRAWLIGSADFWRLWFVGLVVFTVRWVETVAVGVFVYQRTGSAFLVAMMTMLRLLPMGLFGAFLGAIAERIERRTSLLIVLASM